MSTTPTERRLAITPEIVISETATGRHKVVTLSGNVIATVSSDHQAVLFANAHNTYNACHLTPSELLAKLSEAEEELRNIADAKRYNNRYFENDTEFASWAISRAAHRLEKLNLPNP